MVISSLSACTDGPIHPVPSSRSSTWTTTDLQRHPGRTHVRNSIWMLSDFTAENGATRVVPGKHLSEQTPDVLDDPAATHPDEMLLLGKAGTVVVFDSHMWHGTTHNGSRDHRYSLTSFFCRRDDPHMVFSSALSSTAKARLSAAARCLFVDPEPWTA